MQTLRCVAAFMSLLALAPTAARAEEDFALWNKRMAVGFGGYAPPGGGAPLTNFPVLVVLGSTAAGAGFDYADFGSPPYGDLRFAAADKTTPLDFEVESWDTEGLSYVWVKVPELTAGTTIYALWGRSGVAAPSCTTNGAVWAEAYNAVWHLCDGADNAHVSDSTANCRHGTKKAANSPAQTAAVIGKGQLFASSYIDVTGVADSGKTHTFSMWLNGGAGSSAANIFPFDVELGRLVVGWGADPAGRIGLYDGGWRYFGNTPSLNTWHHIAFVCGASTVSLYVDGAPYGSAQSYTSRAIGGKVTLGSRFSYANNFPGMIDEARVASVARSADWVWACWMNQGSNGVFNTVGTPEFQDLPFITNPGGATNVTAASAWLCGTLVATGTSATAVSVYWGTADGGTNASDWGADAHWPAPQAPGDFTVQATGLDADAAYFYRFAASNAAGVVWAEPASAFITGEVWIEKTSDAAELGPVPGTFTVHRASGAVGCDLPVSYAVGGTATPGADYAPLGGTLIIPAGAAAAPLVVAPVFDRALEEDETVTVTLLPGPYTQGTPASGTLEITDYRLAVTWDGSGNSTWTQPDATSWSGATYETNGFATFAGAGQGTVTLSGTVTPGGVTVSAGAYTFAGTAIGGDGGLTVSGAGTSLTLNNANTYAEDTVVGAGSTLVLNDNNRLPYGAGKGNVIADGVLSLRSSRNHALNGLSGAGTVRLTGASWESGTLTLGYGDASGVFAGAISNGLSLLNLTKTGSGTNCLNGNLRYRGLTTVNGGMLALGASNTLSGTVDVNAGATLRLGHSGAVWGAPLVAAAGGSTLDTAEMAARVPLASSQTLRIGGFGVTSTLATAPGNGLELLTTSKLHVNAYDGATPALMVTGGGSLTVSSNNAVTVTVAGDVPLPIGDYTLVSGGVAGETPTTYVTVNGAGRAAATTAALLIDGGDLVLRIAAYAPEHEPTSIATAAAGPWDAPATWQGGAVPGPGDRVTVNHAVTLACGTHPLASFSNNAALTFNGWNVPLVAEEVAVNATVTHLAQSATAPDPVSGAWVPDNRVWIVCTNLTLNANKTIDVEGKGYDGYSGPGRGNDYSGGSHGGRGEKGSGPTYGSAEAPIDPGSGGCGSTVAGVGGAGGGVIRIEASGAVTLHGTVSARGKPPPAVVGAGSGGSVFITCRTLAGGGTVSANGGTSANVYSGGGGGGRIAVLYDPAAQAALPTPALTFDANGGRGGDLGTLYFPDNRFLVSPMRHCGQWLAPGLTGWTCDSLVFSNASLRIPVPGFALGVAGDWTMTGAGDSRTYGLQATNAQIACGGGIVLEGCTMRLTTDGETTPALTAGGDLALLKAGTMASALYLHAAKTNGGPRNCGLPVTVGGTFTIATNCTVYPYSDGTDGGSVHFTVGSLCLEAGGLIDANAKGYNSGKGPGASLSQAGASYGGRGAGGGKDPYGCKEWPQDPGSGGRADMAWRGGGLVTIEAAARMRIDGTIRTTGADGGTWSSAASGGGVALSCKWLSGSGSVTANGGGSVHEWCRGAGGRIAIWYLYDNTTGLSNNVAAAKGGAPAEDGTVFWGKRNAPGTVLLLR